MAFFTTLTNAFVRPKIHVYFDKPDPVPITNPFESERLVHTEENSTECLTLHSPIYSNGENVTGRIVIELPSGTNNWKYENVSCLCIGQVHSQFNGTDYVLTSQSLNLDTTGVLFADEGPKTFTFQFRNVDMPCESFRGSAFNVSYYIRVTIRRPGLQAKCIQTRQFLVQNIVDVPEILPKTLQVGVDDCLHIEIKLENINLPTNGFVEGTIRFVINQLKVKSMLVHIERRESIHPSDGNNVIQTARLGAFELMDGCPADNVVIPIRIPLSKFEDLGPSVSTRYFTIRYFLNVTILDTEDRKYFKQTEVLLHRESINWVDSQQ